MSVVQHQELAISSDQNKYVRRVGNKNTTSETLVEILSKTSPSQDIDHYDSTATTQATDTQSSRFPSQSSPLSSQEMIKDPHEQQIRSAVVANTINPAERTSDAMVVDKTETFPTNGMHEGKVNNSDKTISTSPQRGVLGPAHKLDTIAGQKRTANGEIKHSNSVSPVNQLGMDLSAMSNTSPQRSVPRSPQIGQLTAKLRARLSYAAVKVQHGWESKTINEVESLAAQHLSPRVPNSDRKSLSGSPQRNLMSSPERPVRNLMMSPNMLSLGKRSPDSLSSSSGASEIGDHRYAPLASQSQKPSLAPPVDLGPRNPRRSNPSTFAPPKMDAKPNSNLSESSIASNRPQILATPPTLPRPLGQTMGSGKPSTAMEQDAIETLLFMSSPGNTQHRPNSQQASTPPHQGNITLQKKSKLSVESTLPRILNTDAIPISPRKVLIPDKIDLGNDQNIDRVLDEMPQEPEEDDSSSDEIDLDTMS